MCSERKKGARNVYLHHFPMHRTWYLPLILESIPFIVLKTSNNVQLAFSFLLFCLMSTLNLQEFEKEHQSFWVWLRLKLAKKARTCENIQTSEGRERNRKKKVNCKWVHSLVISLLEDGAGGSLEPATLLPASAAQEDLTERRGRSKGTRDADQLMKSLPVFVKP